jgi:DNA repair exonuclease SbcCD ATPase subunit
MAACDDVKKEYKDARAYYNEAQTELKVEQREQFENYKEYHSVLRDGYAEFVILALFGEGALGMALGGYTAFFSGEVNDLEDKIDALHEQIQETKEDLANADAAVADAERRLCDCYRRHGGE